MSTVLAAKQDLLGQLSAAAQETPALQGVAVYLGPPTTTTDWESVAIWEGEAEFEPKILGRQPAPLEEEYRITLLIDAVTSGSRDFPAVEARSWEMARAVMDAIRAHRPDAAFHHYPSKAKQSYLSIDKAIGSRVELTVTGKARI